MKTEMVNKLSRSMHKFGFKLKKYSPEILVGTGVVGVVASTVMACKATLKVNDILDDTKEKVEKIKAVKEDPNYVLKYSEEDAKKDLTIVYTQTGVQLAKLYGPAIVLGAVSIGSILMSHKILSKRNVALAAAYATIEKGFKEYRGRVVERFGERIDYELKHNIKAKEIEETVVDENGNEKTEKKVVDTIEINGIEYSEFAKFFDEYSSYWKESPEYNLTFLKQQERYANDKLKRNGYLFLNDVYDMLDIPRTQAGQIVGWVYDEKNPMGDNYVDFGISDVYKEGCRKFVNGYEKSILLDFNVDGNILKLM